MARTSYLSIIKSSLSHPQDSHLDVQTQDWKQRDGKVYPHTLGNQEKAGVATLVRDKRNIKQRL